MRFSTLIAYLDYAYIYIGILLLFIAATISKETSNNTYGDVVHKTMLSVFSISLTSILLCLKMHLLLVDELQITDLISVFIGALLLIYFYAKRKTLDIEIYTILFLIYWSFMVLIENTDLVILYASLEIQTFCYCILITWQKRKTLFGAEGALKYFLFGNLASILFLVGGLYVYYAIGVVDLNMLADVLYQQQSSQGNTAILFFALAFMFKLGAVPFQFWLPDAYEAASLDVLSLLAFFRRFLFIIYFIVFNIYLLVMDFPL